MNGQGTGSVRAICVSDRLPGGTVEATLRKALPDLSCVTPSELLRDGGLEPQPDVFICHLDSKGFDPFVVMERARFLRPAPLICAVGGSSLAAVGFRLFGLAHARFGGWEELVESGSLQRFLLLRDRLLAPDMLSFVRGLRRLPVLPETYARFRQELRAPSASLADVARILEGDPAAAAQILRAANSGYFARGHQVRRVAEAATLLGVDLLGTLVLAFGVFTGAGQVRVGELSAGRLLGHALLTASFARAIALAEDRRDLADDAFLAGILHDIGHYALLLNFPVRMADVEEIRKRSGVDHCAAELQVFGVDHASLGSAIISHWNLPFSLVQSVLYHHAPSKEAEQGLTLTAILHVAASLASELDGMDEDLRVDCLDVAGLPAKVDVWRALCRGIHRSVSVA